MVWKRVMDVMATLIWDGDKFLIRQHPVRKARELLREFVGGNMELEATKEQALVLGCQEELAIIPSLGEVFMKVDHQYPNLNVHLTLFNSVICDGTPRILEYHDIRWITPEEIPQDDFCPADDEILRRLRLEN